MSDIENFMHELRVMGETKMKLCKDCKFFKPMDFGDGSFFNISPPKPSECLSEFCVDLVDGSKNTVPYARREICGVDGKYWEKNND